MSVARTLGELRQSPFTAQRLGSRRVKDELRENLMSRLREGGPIFPGIVGYDDTVVPQIVNAILAAQFYSPRIARTGEEPNSKGADRAA